MRTAVICLTRVPLPSQTKTRLMPYLSGAECAALHTAFLRDIAAVCANWTHFLFCTPNSGWQPLRGIFPHAAGFFPQESGDLGARMENALNHVLSLGYDACVLIGSDLPLLTAAHLQSAFSALETADVTLGPTPDGGYYLVGLKAPCPALFVRQTYGTENVCKNAVRAARQAGARVLPALSCRDVDTPEDLLELRATIQGNGSWTAQYLQTLFGRGRRDDARERIAASTIHT